MTDLYLCSKPLAKTPYYLEDVSKNIYSLEELCYYLLQNVILLDKTFMSAGLCSWIRDACGYSELADRLDRKRMEGCSLAEFAGAIMKETGFCKKRDVDDVNYLLRQMEEKSDFERGKIRADRMMENHRYISAIYEYKRILKMRAAQDQNPVLLALVWHNLGCASAKMLSFTEAEACFEMSYNYNGKSDTLSKLLLTTLCRKDEEGFLRRCNEYHISERSKDMLRSEYRRAANTEETREFRLRLDRLEDEKAEGRNVFQQEIGDIISEWKEEYRSYCRI